MKDRKKTAKKIKYEKYAAFFIVRGKNAHEAPKLIYARQQIHALDIFIILTHFLFQSNKWTTDHVSTPLQIHFHY